MSFNFIGIQRERADHEKSVEGRVIAVRIDRRSVKSEDRGRLMRWQECKRTIRSIRTIKM
jgi:hypothetical protein